MSNNDKAFYENKLMDEKKKAEIRELKREINNVKHDKANKKKVTTTKKLIAYILINCTVVELYSMFVMFYLRDLTALYTLIGAVVTESISFAIYCAKAFKETKEEETLKFERDKFKLENNVKEDIDVPDMSGMSDIVNK